MRVNVMQVSACVTVMAAAVAAPIILLKTWKPEEAAAAASPPAKAQTAEDPRYEIVSRENVGEPGTAVSPVDQDRTWYVVAQDDCFKLKVAMGVDTPEQAIAALNADGGRFDYFKRTNNMVGIVQPLGPRFAFVRGYSRCRISWGVAMSAGASG